MKSVKTFNPKSWPRAVNTSEYTVPGTAVCIYHPTTSQTSQRIFLFSHRTAVRVHSRNFPHNQF